MKHEFTIQELSQALKEAWNFTELARELGYSNPSSNVKDALRKLCEKYSLDYSHLKKTPRPRFCYSQIAKTCPICGAIFSVSEGSPKEKTVCSRACSNTFFRSGPNNPNYKGLRSTIYRQKAFRFFPNQCNRCGWSEYESLLRVHHIDRNRSNNELSNLEILCLNCHAVEHRTR